MLGDKIMVWFVVCIDCDLEFVYFKDLWVFGLEFIE